METEIHESHLTSRYVHEAVGVPDDEDVVKAIDAWANVWGDEVCSLVNHEGLLDMEDPQQKAASEHLADAAEALKRVLPGARFMTGLVTFDGGHVQLSA